MFNSFPGNLTHSTLISTSLTNSYKNIHHKTESFSTSLQKKKIGNLFLADSRRSGRGRKIKDDAGASYCSGKQEMLKTMLHVKGIQEF